MILSVSRRTDIPAFYPEWFIDKIEQKSVCVRNPMNPGQISRIALEPDNIDCIVFWTKNPARLMPRLAELDALGYWNKYYFTFTLNYYGKDLEPNMPEIEDRIKTFIALSKSIGRERVIWRYDPIVITPSYTPEWHAKCFATLCDILADHTSKAVVSIVDIYSGKNYPKLAAAGFRQIDYDSKMDMFRSMADSAINKHGIALATCAENMPELEPLGIIKNSCVDRELIEKLTGKQLMISPSKSRSHCGCCDSVDIGCYDSCPHGCAYCYACNGAEAILSKMAAYDPSSPLLCDKIRPGDKIHDRQVFSHDINKIPI